MYVYERSKRVPIPFFANSDRKGAAVLFRAFPVLLTSSENLKNGTTSGEMKIKSEEKQ